MTTAVLFDLDGTLIDSAGSILSTFDQALSSEGLAPVIPLDAALIGPPLRETMHRLSGVEDPLVLDRLCSAFKSCYDSGACLEARPFPGIEPMLVALREAGLTLHIATNKRAVPTGLILGHLGWADLFQCVYALDAFAPALLNKAELLARLLTDAGLDPAHGAYVGDREEDALAAQANRLRFFWAAWGFGGTPSQAVGGETLSYPSAGPFLGGHRPFVP